MIFIIPLGLALVLFFISFMLFMFHAIEADVPASARYGTLLSSILLLSWLIAFSYTPNEVMETKVIPVQFLDTEGGTIAAISYLDRYGDNKLVNLNKYFHKQIPQGCKVKVKIFKLGPYLGMSNIYKNDEYKLIECDKVDK